MLEAASGEPSLQSRAGGFCELAECSLRSFEMPGIPPQGLKRALRCLATVEGALLLARVQQSPELLRTLVAARGENHRPSRAAEDSAHE